MLKRFVTSKRVVIGAYLSLGAFLLAHTVNAFVAHSLFVPEILPPPLPSQDTPLLNSVSPQQLAQDMVTRGLFALPAESLRGAGSSTGAGLGPPLEAAKKLLLHGTALGIGDKPMAIVQDRSSQQQRLLHLHDRVPNVGELVSIEKTRVLFQDGGQEEWLELAMLPDLEQARRIPPPPEPIQRRPLAVSQLPGPTQPVGVTPVLSPTDGNSRPIQVIDRRELTKILSDIPQLLLQAQPVVSMIDGRFDGILLEAVRADGLYTTMGLYTGDVLKRFNGMELREPSMLIAALEQMKYEQRVKLDLVRNETPRTLTYEIR